MNILVIGAGSIGTRHHQNLQALGATSTLMHYREFVERSGHPSKSGALSKEAECALRGYDGVVVATETHIRVALISHLARAGLPLYIEKPLAYRSEDVELLLKVTSGIASRSVLGFMMRYHPAIQYLAAICREDIFSISLEIGHDVRQWRPGRQFRDSYAAQPDGGGVLLDLCHELDIACCLLRDPELHSVRCIGHEQFPDVDFSTRTLLSGRGPVLGVVSMDYLAPVMHRSVSVRGRQESHEFDLVRQRYVRIIDSGEPDLRLNINAHRDSLFIAAMGDFLNLVSGRPVGLQHNFPRLDRVAGISRLVASAWEKREFVGKLQGTFC